MSEKPNLILVSACGEIRVHMLFWEGLREGGRAKERGLDLVLCWGRGQGSLDSD